MKQFMKRFCSMVEHYQLSPWLAERVLKQILKTLKKQDAIEE